MIAIIPARSGSKGVKNKNIKLLGDKHLIAYSILAAKKIPEVKRIIVSTDSEEYAEIARKYGAEVPFLRPKKFADDNSTDLDVFSHIIEWFDKKNNQIPELFIHLRPTSPLRDPNVLNQAIMFFKKNINNSSSMRSAHVAPESPFIWFLKDEISLFQPISGNFSADILNQPRQSFPDVYVPNGYIDIVKSSTILNENKLHGTKMLVFESPFCAEVDTEDDFKFLEYSLEKDRSFYNKIY